MEEIETKKKALEFKNISKSYGPKKVLNNISFFVEKGTIHGFIGPNGSGKTTTMSIAVKLVIPNAGDVLVNEKSIKTNFFTNSEIGFCPAEVDMMKEVEVEDFIVLYNGLRGLEKSYIMERLEESPIKKFRYYKLKSLSTGWRKIVQIFNATLSSPNILLLDEPFNGLDPLIRRDVINRILEWKKKGTSVLLSTHILSDLQELADDISIIKEGEIVYTGKKTTDIEKTYDDFFRKEGEVFF